MATKADDELLETPPDAQTELDAAPPETVDVASTTEGAEAVVQKLPYEELGLDESYKDAADYQTVAKRLADERKQAEEQFNQRLVATQHEWERRTAENWQQYQLRQQQSAAQPATAQEKAKWWNVPADVQAEWFDQYVKIDPETGEHKIVGAPAGVEEKMLAYAKHKREHDQRFNYDRENYLREAVSHIVPEMVRAQIEEFEEVRVANQEVAEFERENATWLYESYIDERTQQRVFVQEMDYTANPPVLRPKLSSAGQQVVGTANNIAAGNRRKARMALDYASKYLLGEQYLDSQLAARRAEQAKETSDKRRLDAADANSKRRGNRNGSEGKVETRDAPAQNTSSRAMFSALFDSLASPDGTFDPAAV